MLFIRKLTYEIFYLKKAPPDLSDSSPYIAFRPNAETKNKTVNYSFYYYLLIIILIILILVIIIINFIVNFKVNKLTK